MKKNSQKQRKRGRKNPEEKVYADKKFIQLLIRSITNEYDGIRYLSNTLSYLILGDKYCRDCSNTAHKRKYNDCICEKCLNDHNEDSYKNCNQNYCICGLLGDHENILDSVITVAKENLNESKILILKNYLFNIISMYEDNYTKGEKNRAKYVLERL